MLTEVAIKQAKPSEKTYRLYDERRMHLEVRPSGSKIFCLRYRFEGKERVISLGSYPETGLKLARERRDKFRQMVWEGVDPAEHRKVAKAAVIRATRGGFEIVAREWFSKQSPNWAAGHSKTTIARLEADIFPWLGSRPIDEITSQELLATLRRVEARGALETAHREMAICGQIFRYAIATGRAKHDISADLKGALAPVPKENHHAAVTNPKRLGEILRMMADYQGTFVVRCALNLAPLVFVRPGELRHALWSDIFLDEAEWRFVVSKTHLPHIVPLSRQAVEILREIQSVTGHGQFVFPSPRSPQKPMSENGVLAALRCLGISKEEMTPHGFRATARTLLDEVLKFPAHLIEHQLAHNVRDPLGRAYNRTSHLEERRVMMQRWADYLDDLRGGSHDN
jgi:integrase